MFVIRDRPPSFEDVTGHVVQSVIAIGVGTRVNDDAPHIVGTGFAIEWAEHFVTCWHVAKAQDELSGLTPSQLRKKGLKDAKLRVALRKGDDYIWREIEAKTWFRVYDETNDICVYRIVGVAVPPLKLRGDQGFVLGTKVGVLGFPMGNLLQGDVIRPFVLNTVVSGGLEMPGDKVGSRTSRIALGTAVAGGFSGGPVFSANDGGVLGMIASKAMEQGRGARWPAGISLAVPAGLLEQVLQRSVAGVVPTIKDALRQHLP